MTADPLESSFVKAIELAEGRVLSVLDAEGVTYSRVWVRGGGIRAARPIPSPGFGC